jgi:glyoxylase-like metal-dependent hydrolase (beta-lactamase superfamily II)
VQGKARQVLPPKQWRGRVDAVNIINEILPGIFRMEIPLPGHPLKATNSYVVMGEDKNLVIDTGMNRRECREAIDESLKALSVDLRRTDFFITHYHSDHFGLVSDLVRSSSSKVYLSHPDSLFVTTPNIWDKVISMAVAHGFPKEEIEPVMQKHPGRKYQQREPVELTCLEEGDQLSVGSYCFSCVETPGHTRGHLCLYEPQAKIFFSGDHIMKGITPSIVIWDENENSLQRYLDSLNKIEQLDISRVLPGHRRVFTDHRKRIAEIKHHHDLRLNNILMILTKGSQSAYGVASRMKWNISCDMWEDFPALQKWSAFGESLSHLRYLFFKKEILMERLDGKILFSSS